MSKTVKEIVEDYLSANGYDGLFHGEGDGCGCGIDDLMCCGYVNEDCEPAYHHPEDCQCETCTEYRNKIGKTVCGLWCRNKPPEVNDE